MSPMARDRSRVSSHMRVLNGAGTDGVYCDRGVGKFERKVLGEVNDGNLGGVIRRLVGSANARHVDDTSKAASSACEGLTAWQP